METIIPPKGGSGTVHLSLGITKEEWDMEQMRMKIVEEAARRRAVSAMKMAQNYLSSDIDHLALNELQDARRHIDCLRNGGRQ